MDETDIILTVPSEFVSLAVSLIEELLLSEGIPFDIEVAG